jgi:cytochrome c-type biogenesis protein CcmE
MITAHKKPLLVVAALLISLGIVAYFSMGGIESNLVYYLSPQELLQKGAQAKGASVRLGGVVVRHSIQWDTQKVHLNFALGEDPSSTKNSVRVGFTGAVPQMFQEGMGAVVEGTYDGALFHAERVMVKHSNEYRAPVQGQEPGTLYKTLLPSNNP